MKIETGIEKVFGEWTAYFKIDNQSFNLYPAENKKMAKWFLKQLNTAFKKLEE